ncbi:MAG: Hsp20/alpha crystallin family protein [Candidatus Zixiibacteriota bacterium]
MTKSRRVKGLHDITTMQHQPGRERREVGGVGLGGPRSVDEAFKRNSVASPRTWVFSTRPRFVRQVSVEKSLLVEKVEEPRVNVLEEVEEVVVLAEMPGADQESINCKIEDDILLICAEAKDTWGTKRYEKEILLPFAVRPDHLKTSYENQILEIKLSRSQKHESSKTKNKKGT